MPYAGFWRRFAAWLVGVGVFYAAFMAAMLVLIVATGFSQPDEPPSPETAGAIFILMVCAWTAPLVYAVLTESSRYQATLGKLAVGIKVTDLTGRRISVGRALGRALAHVLTGFTFIGGFVMAAFTERRQALHDMVAGTVVVAKEFVPAEGATVPAGSRMPGWAIALAAVGALLPIGLLGAIAIPAYQDYTIRSQVMDGLKDAGAFQQDLKRFALSPGAPALEDIDSASFGATNYSNSPFVESIEIRKGSIFIRYGKQAHERIHNKVVTIRALRQGETIAWVCGRARPAGSRGEGPGPGPGATTVSDRYLPPGCRKGYVAAGDVET